MSSYYDAEETRSADERASALAEALPRQIARALSDAPAICRLAR